MVVLLFIVKLLFYLCINDFVTAHLVGYKIVVKEKKPSHRNVIINTKVIRNTEFMCQFGHLAGTMCNHDDPLPH